LIASYVGTSPNAQHALFTHDTLPSKVAKLRPRQKLCQIRKTYSQ
jgi:hypothetical protein